jgi:transposase, IS5 family
MARRDSRQLGLADSIVRRRGKKSVWLDQLDVAIDWAALEGIVAGIYASREGGPPYPLLAYVKLLLLQQWHGLSDEGLEAAVDDRLSFRRFAGIPLAEGVPDHSSIWRFREQLARRGLAERLLAEVNRQLDAGCQGAGRPQGHADRRHHPGSRGAAARRRRGRGLGA